MASVSFSYRSSKPKAFLEVRLAYRIEKNSTPISFYTRSNIEVEREYFVAPKPKEKQPKEKKSKEKKSKIKSQHERNTTDPVLQNKQKNITNEIINLRTVVLDRFNKTPIEKINKDWFVNLIDELCYPKEVIQEVTVKDVPTFLIDYIPYYLEARIHEMKPTLITKYNVIKHKLERFESAINTRFEIKDIDEKFLKEFVLYYKKQDYSQNTMHRDWGFIKTICRHARSKGIGTSSELDKLKLTKARVKNIYFSKEELNILENLKDLPPHLDNARDWLVISCHCGQRISDFLRFNKKMIVEKKGVKLLKFTQKKTGKEMSIALSSTIVRILDKRNGEFPQSIYDQKYNEDIKEVCKIAGFNEMNEGKKQINIAEDDKENGKKIRAISGTFPKYELVTSHIGRRTFSTLKRDSMPLNLLMSMTGHSTESALNTYLQMENDDKAIEAYKYL
jgi:hypothetical protein